MTDAPKRPAFFDREQSNPANGISGLKPLVRRGEDRETVLNSIVEQWLVPLAFGTTDAAIEQHYTSGGFVLDGVSFFDGNTNQDIDLRELLSRLEERLIAEGKASDFCGRPDLAILIRNCQINRCTCANLTIRPRFVACHTIFEGEANFTGAVFADHADFRKGTFRGMGRFDSALFGNAASFHQTIFATRASFEEATFGSRADFSGASFELGVNMSAVSFADAADCRGCDFGGGSDFCHARFPNADLRYARGFRPDETFVRGAHFSSGMRDIHADLWTQLRARYTGPLLIFNLIFLSLFFLPFVGRVMMWGTMGVVEERLASVGSAMQDVQNIEDRLPGGAESDWHQTSVWRAALGVNQGILTWLPAVIMLMYNVGRGWLTWKIAPLRDAEDRSGITPSLGEYEGLGALHTLVFLLLFFAVASFVWNAWVWLRMPVWMPG